MAYRRRRVEIMYRGNLFSLCYSYLANAGNICYILRHTEKSYLLSLCYSDFASAGNICLCCTERICYYEIRSKSYIDWGSSSAIYENTK